MINDQIISEVKERILVVARDLFIEKGFNGTSIRDIAAASETNVAMVNYYFRSKYNLFEIVFEDSLDILTKKMFNVFSSDLPFFELIEKWIDSYYEILLKYPHIPIFVFNEISHHPEGLTKRLKDRKPGDIYCKMAERIEIEKERGTIKNIEPIDLLLNIASLCIFPFMMGRLAINVASISVDEYKKILKLHRANVIEFVCNALKT